MRRNLFGRPSEQELPTVTRATAREALLFDVRDHTESGDLTLAERLGGSWTFAPWIVRAGHLIMAISLFLRDRPSASWGTLTSVLLPFGLALGLDTAAGLIM